MDMLYKETQKPQTTYNLLMHMNYNESEKLLEYSCVKLTNLYTVPVLKKTTASITKQIRRVVSALRGHNRKKTKPHRCFKLCCLIRALFRAVRVCTDCD